MRGEELGSGMHRRPGRAIGELPLRGDMEQRTAGAVELPARDRAQPQRPLRVLQGQRQVAVAEHLGVADRGAHQARIAQTDGRRRVLVQRGTVQLLDPRLQHPTAGGDRPGAAGGDAGVDDRLPAQTIEQRMALRLVTAGQPGQEGAHTPILPHSLP